MIALDLAVQSTAGDPKCTRRLCQISVRALQRPFDCEVLEVAPYQRLVYSWKGGHESNVGYGSLLDTVVTWTLQKIESGTRLKMVHSGFVLPKNEGAYKNMSGGWKKVVPRVGEIAGEHG